MTATLRRTTSVCGVQTHQPSLTSVLPRDQQVQLALDQFKITRKRMVRQLNQVNLFLPINCFMPSSLVFYLPWFMSACLSLSPLFISHILSYSSFPLHPSLCCALYFMSSISPRSSSSPFCSIKCSLHVELVLLL